MKKLLIFLMAILFAMPVMAKEIKYSFEWTPNTEPTMARYVMYHRINNAAYNYEIPIKVFDCTIQNGKCLTAGAVNEVCSGDVTLNIDDGAVVTNKFVLRAEDAEGDQSGDSNEALADPIDLAPIVAANITNAFYNETAKSIDMAFTQPDADRADHWDLFMSTTSGQGYTKIDTLQNDGSGDTFTISWPITAEGQYYFTIVTFTKEEIFSPNSNEVSVLVKTHPSPTKDFKIKIRLQ